MKRRSIHHWLTRKAVALGPENPILQLLLKAACARHGARLRFSQDEIDVVKDKHVIRVAARHFPYVMDLTRSFDTFFAQLTLTPVGGSLILDCSQPRLQRYAQSGLEFELTSLPEEMEALESYFRWYRPRPGDIVFDVGAYCGVSTYFLSKSVAPHGKVFSFEPDATNFALLQRNLDRHALSNVVPLNLAIADVSGSALFCSEGNLGSGLSRDMSRATIRMHRRGANHFLGRCVPAVRSPGVREDRH